MQQHLMQMQPMMAGYTPTNVTTDHIQQYLDENKSLILKILENQNSGKMSECAENQARLQRNLMYLAAIADSQPQQSSVHTQFPSAVAQPGANYMQHQQAQSMPAQSIMTSRSSTIYSQQTLSAMQQHQALHNQLGVSSGGSDTGLHMFHNESGMAGGNPTIGSIRLSNFGRSKTSEDFQGGNRGTTVSSAGSGEGRTGHSGGRGESIYSEEGEEESN